MATSPSPAAWPRRKPKDGGPPGPHPAGTHERRRRQGHVRAIAPALTHRGNRRLFRCRTWATHVAAPRETVCFALRPVAATVVMALQRLRVRVALAGLSGGLGVPAATGVAWRCRAAPQADARHPPLLRQVPVPQGHLDERWPCIARQHARETDAAGESWPAGEDGRPWVWGRVAPACRLMRAAGGAAPTRHRAGGRGGPPGARGGAAGVLQRGLAVVCGGAHRRRPRRAHVGAHGQARAPPPAPLCAPPRAGLRAVGHTAAAGHTADAQHARRAGGRTPRPTGPDSAHRRGRTAHPDRRPAFAPLVRQTYSFCTDRARLPPRVVCFQAFSHVARPPMRLRQQWSLRARTHHGAMRPRWRERTPAMAAGVTDHVWTLRALLTATFEPLESQSISQ